jgi:transketolase
MAMAAASANTHTGWETRFAFGAALTDAAARHPEVVALSHDSQDLLGLRPFRERYPDRFVEVGIAEQNIIGVAAGLATAGLAPFACGYAPFLTARSMEQVRNDVAYCNLRVTIGAACSGISLGVSGGTHHALEDLALMRSLPNMTVLVPADGDEAYKATWAALEVGGPVYLRLGGRAGEPAVSDPAAPFVIGRSVELRPGNDVAIIACGCMVELAVRASKSLAEAGIGARVVNMHSIKPLDTDAILKAAAETRGIVSAEEHHLTGGLGGAIAELLAVHHPTRMRLVGMPDTFAEVGPPIPLRAKYGMSAEAIEAACRSLLDA